MISFLRYISPNSRWLIELGDEDLRNLKQSSGTIVTYGYFPIVYLKTDCNTWKPTVLNDYPPTHGSPFEKIYWDEIFLMKGDRQSNDGIEKWTFSSVDSAINSIEKLGTISESSYVFLSRHGKAKALPEGMEISKIRFFK